jgi:tripartite-type tricarboxylate transporter receptor subunit TctC
MKRFIAFAWALTAVVSMSLALPVIAQDKNRSAVQILVGFPPGGTADVMARAVADKMKDTLGQPVHCRERPGPSARIAGGRRERRGARRLDDHGHADRPMAVVPHTYKTLLVRSAERLRTDRHGLDVPVRDRRRSQSGAKTWSEYVAWAKANPGKSSYATSGAGSLPTSSAAAVPGGGIDMLHVRTKARPPT